MPVINNGKANIVEGEVPSSLTIKFFGSNCKLYIGENARLSGVVEFHDDEQLVSFGGDHIGAGTAFIYLKGKRCRALIGRGLKINNTFWANLAEDDGLLEIGDECLFGSAKFRTSDSHKIFDIDSGERINRQQPIRVGHRVWISEDVLVLKGADIGGGSIIGARSIVTGVVAENCLAAGSPLRVLKTNVRWAE